MKKQLRCLAAVLAAGSIVTGSMFTVQVQAYAADKTPNTIYIDPRYHFDENGYVAVNGLLFHKIRDNQVEVSKGLDFDTLDIEIPSSIRVDDDDYKVVVIAANAFKNTTPGDDRVYAAQKITIPDTLYEIGSECFYDLVNVESLDLSCMTGGDYYSYLPIDRDVLNMNKGAKLDRVKVSQIYYINGYSEETEVYRLFTNTDFHPLKFAGIQYYNVNLSYWYIKDNVNINELQEPEKKEGYTFIEWISENQHVNYDRGEKIDYINYKPSYKEGKPLWQAEDKIKSSLNKIAVNEDTNQTDILNFVKACITSDKFKSDNITYTVDDFIIVPSKNGERGKLKCTINLFNQLNNSKKAIEVDKDLSYLPEEVKIQSLMDKYRYKESTTEKNIIDYLTDRLDDVGLDIKIDNFTNDKKQIKGTIIITSKFDGSNVKYELNKTLADLNDHDNQRKQNLEQAYEIVKANLEKFNPSNTTTEEEAIKYLSNGIKDSAIEISIGNFENKNYTVKGTIKLYDADTKESKTLELDKTFVSQSVQEAVDIINKNLTDYVPTNTTKESEVIQDLTKGIKDADIKVTIPDFNNDGQTVTGTILVSGNDGTSAEVTLNKKTALVGGTGDNSGTNPGPGGTQTGSVTTPATGGTVNNSSTSSSSAAGGNASANPNNTNNNTNTTGDSNSSVSGGNSTNNNTNTTGNNTNTTGNNSVSLDNLSISGGGSTSSTGAVTVNPYINNSTPVNVTVNLNGFELVDKDKATAITKNGIVMNNIQKENKDGEDELLKLLILKYLQGIN